MTEPLPPADCGISPNQAIDEQRAQVRMYELALSAMRKSEDDLAYRLAKSASCNPIGSVGNLNYELKLCGLSATDIAHEITKLLQPEIMIAPTRLFVFGVPPAHQAAARARVVEAFGASPQTAVEFWASTEAATAFLTDVQHRAEKIAEETSKSHTLPNLTSGALYVAASYEDDSNDPDSSSLDGCVLKWIKSAMKPVALDAIVVRGQAAAPAHVFGGLEGQRRAFVASVRRLLVEGHIRETIVVQPVTTGSASHAPAIPTRGPSLGHAILSILRASPQGRTVAEMLDTLFSMGVFQQGSDAAAMHIAIVDMIDTLCDKVMSVQSTAPPFAFKYAMRPLPDAVPLPEPLDWRNAVIGAIGYATPFPKLNRHEITLRAYDIIDLRFDEGANKYPMHKVSDNVRTTLKRMLATGDLVQDGDLFTRAPMVKCKVCNGHCPGEAFAYCRDCGINEQTDVCNDCGRRSAKHAAHDEAKAKAAKAAADALNGYPSLAMWNPNPGGAVVPWCQGCQRELSVEPGTTFTARALMQCMSCGKGYIEQDDMWLARIGAAVEKLESAPIRSPRTPTFKGT